VAKYKIFRRFYFLKRIILIVVMLVLGGVLTACIYDDADLAFETPSGQFQPSIPIDVVEDLFGQVQAIWDADDGNLWGFHLQAPLMIADPITRHALTNMPDAYGDFQPIGGIYGGVLPNHVFISHTITDFAGLTWGMMAWEPMIIDMISDHGDDVVRLLIHEAFHVLQNEMVVGDWPMEVDQTFAFLSHSADARVTVLMEAQALAHAVQSEGEERFNAIHDALSIRAHRRTISPEAAISENAQEILEGLSIFTEILTFDNANELMEAYLPRVTGGAQSTGLSVYPYFTGAMYAILLKETGADRQTGITFYTDLAAILQEHLSIEITPFEQLDTETWNYSEIAEAQHAWVLEFQRMMAQAEDFVAQEWLLIPGDNFIDGASFEALEVLFVDNPDGWDYFVQYGTFSMIFSDWILHISDGFSSPSWYPNVGVHVMLYENIQISEDGLTATAPTWTIEVTNPAYQIQIDNYGKLIITQN